MKKIYLLVFAACIFKWSDAQVLTEDFNYTTGTLLTANGWTATSGTGTNNLTVNATGLTYSGSPSSGVGFGVNMTTSGQDVAKTFTAINSGSIYNSFFLNVSAAQATGDYMEGLMTGTTGSPAFALRVYIRSSGAGFVIGCSKGGAAATYDATVRSFGTVYLVVAKYTYNTGNTTDDVVSLWIEPGLGGAEGVPTITNGVGSADAAAAGITGTFIRQGTAGSASTQEIDGIRTGVTWAEVTPSSSLPSLSVSTSSFSFGSQAVGSQSASQNFTLSGGNLTGAPGNITVTAPSTDFQVSNDDATWGPSTTIAYASATLSATPVYVRFTPQSGGVKSGNITFSGGGVTTPPTVALSGTGTATYYSKAAGNLTDVATWGINTDGTGAAPADFVSDGQQFIISNRAAVTLNADWTVSGSGSKVIAGSGLTLEFTIPPTAALTGTLDVSTSATVVLQHTTLPTLGTLANGSTVNFAQAGAFTVPQRTYHNLTLTGGNKVLAAGTTTIGGNFVLDGVTGFNGAGSPFSTLSLAGDFTMQNSAAFEPNGTGDANRLTLILTGSGAQTISGGDLYVFRLQTPNAPATTLNIFLAAANLFLGNTTSGGLNLQQATHTLTLNGNTLTIQQAGFFSATNTGLINGNNASSIVVNKTAGATAIGAIAFATGGELLNTLSFSSAGTGTNNLTLNSSLAVNDLTLTAGNIILGANNLTVNNSITGGSAASHVVTSSTGTLNRQVTTTAVIFPVGPSATLYHPATITNTGTSDNFSVRVSSTDPPCSPTVTSVNATWDISEAVAGGSICDLSFDYNGAATGASYTTAGAQIVHCNGAVADYHNGSVTGTVASGTGFTTFSPFGITNDITVLPLSLTVFDGSKNGNVNNINWKAACSGNGNYTFELLRSNDGTSFTSVYAITADEVRCQQPFAYADFGFTRNAVNYYRLKMTDIDGRITYSRIIRLINQNSGIDLVQLMPNVTHDKTTVVVSAAKAEKINVVVTDINGRMVTRLTANVTAGTNSISLNTSSFQAGIYLVQVQTPELKTPALRLVKQ